jgi:hypothetical protein
MELNPGMLVYVNHYSGKRPIVSSVVDTEEDGVKVIMTEKFKRATVFKNDPIVLNFEMDKKLYTCEGYITKINPFENIVELRIENSQHMDNNRLFERFPVSLYTILHTPSGKKSVGVLKNLSLSGFAISTKSDLKLGKIYDFEIYIDERVISLKGEVVWQNKNCARNEFGIKSMYPDYIVKNTVNLYLNILKSEQENSIKNVITKIENFQKQ